MRVRSTVAGFAAVVFSLALAGCGNTHNGVFGSPEYIAVTISPRVTSLPQSGSMTFTAAVSNNLGTPQWSLLDPSFTSNAGMLTAVPGSPNSVVYTAPPAPPIYAGAPVAQGTVTIVATTSDPPQSTVPIVPDSLSFYITSPTITVSLNPDTVTVPLGTTTQFVGYETGSANNALTWEVNGLVGGLDAMGNPSPAGTITNGVTGGLYTAPTTMPMTGSAVTITMIPQASPTQAQQSFVTLQ